MASISVPIAMLVTRSRMIHHHRHAECSIHCFAWREGGLISSGWSRDRLAAQALDHADVIDAVAFGLRALMFSKASCTQ